MVLIKPGKVNYLDSDEEDVKDEAATCAEMPKTNDDHKTPLHTKVLQFDLLQKHTFLEYKCA